MKHLLEYSDLLFLLVALITVILMFILVIRGNRVDVGKNGVQAAPAGAKKKSPHAKCAHIKDVIVVLRNRDDLRSQINKIETFKMPRDIMRIAEHGIRDLKEVLRANFVSLMKKVGDTDTDINQLPQVKLYKVMLDSFDTTTLAECRRMMHENNWIEKEMHGEWNAYVSKHAASVIQTYTTMLDEVYVLDYPTRDSLREYRKTEIKAYATEKLRDIMNEMLAVSKHWHKEVSKLEDQMEYEMSNLLGCF